MNNNHDYSEDPQKFGLVETYQKAIAFLDGVGTLEDWGCGTGFAARYVRKARYVGIDLVDSRFNYAVTNLNGYRSKAQYVLLRHTLMPDSWITVLENAVKSYRKKLCVVVYAKDFDRQKLVASFDAPFTEEFVETPEGIEAIYCLTAVNRVVVGSSSTLRAYGCILH